MSNDTGHDINHDDTDDDTGRGAAGRRSKRPALSREAVIGGAVELADQIGVEPLTLRKLATHLGVKPMSIYHYVANKDEIIDGMVDAVFAEIEMPPPETPWRAAMTTRAHSARAALRRHPWAAGMLDSRTNPGPANLGHHDAVIACLRANGFSLPLTGHAFAILDAFIYGFALQESALPGQGGEELTEMADEMMATFAQHFPSLAEFTADHVLQPGYAFGNEFDVGLELILDGLEARRAASVR
ncbi:MAG: TetR family transcriptional regulator [Acidimicrobiaceae bacterium]|nr:TetR family transcriptional regulator [Acidimicrobiaceae bacterium]